MKYEKPQMEVEELEKLDVITLSDGGTESDDETWGTIF